MDNVNGLLKVGLSGTTALSGSDLTLIKLHAKVPNSSPYGNSEVIKITNLRLNEGVIPSKADFAIHKALYLGDVDADGFLSPLDPARISEVVVGLHSGFTYADWTDPLIVADTTGDGTLSSLDATYVAQKIIHIPTPEIPDIPVLPGDRVARTTGVDPTISIPTGISATPGGLVNVPVNIGIEKGASVAGASFVVVYDTNKLQLNSIDSSTYWLAPEWAMYDNATADGTIYFIFYNTAGNSSSFPGGTIANLQFKVNSTFVAGVTNLDVQTNNADPPGLTWTYVDGSILISTATWDGGSTVDSNWTTAANWVGDVVPSPGDNLVFPAGAARLDNINDYLPGTIFGSVVVSGGNYHIQNNPLHSSTVNVQGNAVLTVVSIVSDTLTIGGSSTATAANSVAANNEAPIVTGTLQSFASALPAPTATDNVAIAPTALESAAAAVQSVTDPVISTDTAPFAEDALQLASAAIPVYSQTLSLPAIGSATESPQPATQQNDGSLFVQTQFNEPFGWAIADAFITRLDREFATSFSSPSGITNRLKDLVYVDLADSLTRAKKQSAPAATENVRSLALQSILDESQQGLTAEQEGELLADTHSFKQNKLNRKAVDDFHYRLAACD